MNAMGQTCFTTRKKYRQREQRENQDGQVVNDSEYVRYSEGIKNKCGQTAWQFFYAIKRNWTVAIVCDLWWSWNCMCTSLGWVMTREDHKIYTGINSNRLVRDDVGELTRKLWWARRVWLAARCRYSLWPAVKMSCTVVTLPLCNMFVMASVDLALWVHVKKFMHDCRYAVTLCVE